MPGKLMVPKYVGESPSGTLPAKVFDRRSPPPLL
jgi:hypothetical protein